MIYQLVVEKSCDAHVSLSNMCPHCHRLARDGVVPYYNLASHLPQEYLKAHSATLIVRVSCII